MNWLHQIEPAKFSILRLGIIFFPIFFPILNQLFKFDKLYQTKSTLLLFGDLSVVRIHIHGQLLHSRACPLIGSFLLGFTYCDGREMKSDRNIIFRCSFIGFFCSGASYRDNKERV
jgi:hypothetical protein